MDEKTRCVSFSVACREWWKGAKGGEEGKDGRRAGGTAHSRGIVRANGRDVDVCYVRRVEATVYTLVFISPCIVNLFVVRRIDSLFLSRLCFLFLLLLLPSLSRDVCEAIHRKVTDEKFRIFIVTLVFCTKESWTRIHQSFESGLKNSKFANFSKRWQYYGVSIPLIKTGYRSRSAR